MSSNVRELFDCKRAENEAAVTEAERRAIDGGKQRFDLGSFEKMLKRGPQNEAERRMAYYVHHPELQTMGEFAKYLQNIEPWEDSR
jgi:hypothetical protein